MKNFKRIFALMLTTIMVFTLGIAAGMTASADDDILISIKAPDDNTNYVYSAYQVFKGDLVDGKLLNIDWGTGIDSTKTDSLLAALKADTKLTDGTNNIFKDCKNAAQVAEILAEYENDSDIAFEFAEVVSGYLASTATATSTYNTTSKTYDIAPAAVGYYLIKNTDTTNNPKTRFMLEVLGQKTNAVAKAILPTLDKKIDTGTSKVSQNSAQVGDTVSFELTSKVPDMTGYDKYFFIINDTLDKGFTFDPTTVVVKIGETPLTINTDYTVSAASTTDSTKIQIVFKDFIQYNTSTDIGKDITVTYNATINQYANVTAAGNLNSANLTYSNDPNYDYKGETGTDPNPDVPGSGEPTGTTPNSETKTYLTSIKVIKVDDSATPQALTGAEFELKLKNGTITSVIIGYQFVADDTTAATYYKLTDGSYTTTAPDGTNDALYASTTQKYKKVTLDGTQTVPAAAAAITGYVDDDGYLTFKGLNAGEYTLTELVAPAGYNKLLDGITFTINGAYDNDTKAFVWSTTTGSKATYDSTNNVFEVTVVNKAGTTLPSTGGMGTKLFYILGSLMVIGSVIMLVTKKRVATAEK